MEYFEVVVGRAPSELALEEDPLELKLFDAELVILGSIEDIAEVKAASGVPDTVALPPGRTTTQTVVP